MIVSVRDHDLFVWPCAEAMRGVELARTGTQISKLAANLHLGMRKAVGSWDVRNLRALPHDRWLHGLVKVRLIEIHIPVTIAREIAVVAEYRRLR